MYFFLYINLLKYLELNVSNSKVFYKKKKEILDEASSSETAAAS